MRITPVISHPLLFINTKSTDTEKPWFPALTLPRTTTSFLLTKGANHQPQSPCSAPRAQTICWAYEAEVVIQPQAVHRLHHGIIDVGSTEICFFTFRTVFHVCLWDPIFSAYLAKKRAEGKHYNVALSHAAKKLVRLIFAIERSRQPYSSAT